MQFRGVLQLHGKTATGIAIPEEVVLGLGRGKRVPVQATINDYRYRSTVAPYNGQYFLPVSAEARAGAGITAGDEVEVQLEVDDEPRAVELPDDLEAALAADPAARSAFARLSYSNQRALVTPLEQAKSAETRQRRLEKALERLRAATGER